eukprot:6210270-Pleurochrysis_carterae.AAC.8
MPMPIALHPGQSGALDHDYDDMATSAPTLSRGGQFSSLDMPPAESLAPKTYILPPELAALPQTAPGIFKFSAIFGTPVAPIKRKPRAPLGNAIKPQKAEVAPSDVAAWSSAAPPGKA